MLIKEIFDSNFYNKLQSDIGDKMKQRHGDMDDSSDDLGDFIVSQFEARKISFEEARIKIKKQIPQDQQWFWLHELNMAHELKKDLH